MVLMEAVSPSVLRLGVVRFLNAVPLISGLEVCEGVTLEPAVPSRLLSRLEEGAVDLALASSIDYQRASADLCILPVGALGSLSETWTVRLWSAVPFDEMETVCCDTDSHTSVALLKIVLQNKYCVVPRLEPFDASAVNGEAASWPEAVLLIGDKVVSGSPPAASHRYQLDLGGAWRDMTGLPFVFGAWMGRADLPQEFVLRAAMLLDRQRRRNTARLEELVSADGPPRGWQVEEGLRYLRDHIEYASGSDQLESIERFHQMAMQCGVIDQVRPIRCFEV
jgi:chorismate dehydratase